MQTLLAKTTAYTLFCRVKDEARTTLLVFPDAAYLGDCLNFFARAFFADAGENAQERILHGCHPDCLFFPAAGEKLDADASRAIVEESQLLPVEGKKKLFVLNFEGVSATVQNKLLKLFEEPPEGVSFLLGALSLHTILPTVLSRAIKLEIPLFSEEDIMGALKRKGMVGDIRAAAAASGGLLSSAEAILSGGDDLQLAAQFLRGEDVVGLCRKLGDRKEKKGFLAAVKLSLRDMLFSAQEDFPRGAILKSIEYVTDAEKDIAFNANLGQTALSLALKIQKEKERWQRLS